MADAYRKKLIEVALPLDAINAASAREKSIRHGHPSTLHLWWARRPLAACRAVLFASLVDDPSVRPDEFPTEEAQTAERRRLFRLIEELVKWENTTNETVLGAARAEILKATGGNPPPVLDPFCGGGSIPLEAQRLGLEAHASDLNPVAVLITKALIEIPPKFANRAPVHPGQPKALLAREWRGAQGLAEDVRYYGKWMRDEAERRIGHLYPKVRLPKEQGGGEATVIAWLWARTVRCPNPACGARMPLARSFWLSTKKGREVWVEPVIDRSEEPPIARFRIRQDDIASGRAEAISAGTGLVNAAGKKVQATFACVACGVGVAGGEYIDREADAGRLGVMPLAIVAEGARRRVFLPFDSAHEQVALVDAKRLATSPPLSEESPTEPARGTFASNAQGRTYGFKTFADYFTDRQLVALITFSNLVGEVRERVRRDAATTGVPDDGIGLAGGGCGAAAYADAVATYAALAVDRLVESSCSLARWQSTGDKVAGAFSRQSISMLWDYAEVNPFSDSTRNFLDAIEWVAEATGTLPTGAIDGMASQIDASSAMTQVSDPAISVDPPYYDNVSYADLSDFFYIWLRRSLKSTYPQLFDTLLVPKSQELIADAYRQGGREAAQQFFEEALTKAFVQMQQVQCRDYPLTVYYAFKQAEERADGDNIAALASTGWETMLGGLLGSGFAITGTWPMRTERGARTNNLGTNALASSIVLVCRPRLEGAETITRREFIRTLYAELPDALDLLIRGAADISPIAPVDLAQAAIGPGMAIFSRYAEVLEADGSPMRVRTALEQINGAIDAYFSHQEGEQDSPTRFCVGWYRTHGTAEGPFGEAQVLSRAVNVDIAALERRGLLTAGGGKVRLRRAAEYPAGDWDPAALHPLIAWEATHRLAAALAREGVQGAAPLARRLGGKAEEARALAYLLFTEATKRGWADDALGYNNLVVAWPDIQKAAAAIQELRQATLL